MTIVTFIDTSVLCEIWQVPGKSDPDKTEDFKMEMDLRFEAGERFVIPVTAVIETGNHIAQCDGDRWGAAHRLVGLLRMAASEASPWLVLQTEFGPDFLNALCNGDSTGQSLEDLAASKVGAGDVALLVERDHFRSGSAVASTQVWTLDHGLRAAAEVTP